LIRSVASVWLEVDVHTQVVAFGRRCAERALVTKERGLNEL